MNLLVAVDFSDITPRLLEVARAQAAGRDAHVRIVHAVEAEPDFVGFDTGPDVVRDQLAHEWRDERHQLEALARQLREAGVKKVTTRIVQAPIVATILAQAEEHDADLILLGTHGRGVVYQLLVGSTSEGVLRQSTRPLLLVPATEA